VETFWQDVRQGLRMVARNPGFTAVAIATLALGIGANTAIFSVVNAVLLRPLPYAGSDRLVRVSEEGGLMRKGGRGGGPGGPGGSSFITSGTFKDWRESSRTLDGLAAYQPRSYTLTGVGEPVRLRGTAVSTSMFPMLRATPSQGRLFAANEDRPGEDQVAIISEQLWTRQFGRRADIVGKPITLDDRQVTVVGVLPASFYFPDHESELWTPMTINIAPQQPGQMIVMVFSAIGRLKDGASVSQAEAEGTAASGRNQPPPPPGADSSTPLTPAVVRLVPLQAEMVAGVRPALLVLTAAVGFVLLIAAANIANLLLTRGAGRQRELAVRTALGARPRRLARQLLTESMLLAVGGGILGVGLALVLQRALPAISPGNIPRIDEVAVDGRVLLFASLMSLASGLLFGLAPALQGSRVDVVSTLGDAGIQRMGGFRFLKGNRLRSVLVVVEVALSTVLLIGGGLLVRSFIRLIDVNPGYDSANVITAQIGLPETRYGMPGRQSAFFDQLLQRVAAVPGVQSAGTTKALPLVPGTMIIGFGIVGQPRPNDPRDFPRASTRIVSAGYAEAMGLELVAGRLFSAHDDAGTPPVVMVSESLARQYLGGTDKAIGARLQLFAPQPMEVVGVVGDVRHTGLDAEPQPEVYALSRQLPPDVRFGRVGTTALVVRTSGDPLRVVPFLRRAVMDVDRDVPLDNVMTMEARLSASVAAPRFYALLLGLFALMALLLAAIGIYGVLSYNVSQRHREIGVRMALGAAGGDILSLVLGQGLTLAVVGVAIGVAGAFATTRFLRTLLFGITLTDPVTYAGITVLLTGVALLACWIPARRAIRVDPMTALRYE
jgi:putative ABC transport system permease protein